MIVADVVRPSFEKRDRDRHLERVAHEGKVAVEELILERLRSGGDDDFAAGEKRRDEIGEGLAGPRPRFSDELAALIDGPGDRFGHRELLRPQPIRGQLACKRTFRAEDSCEIGHYWDFLRVRIVTGRDA